MPNYYRNVDDSISDPELIAAKYRIGRSEFFEVQLTLAELSDSIKSAEGGLPGSAILELSIALESPYYGQGFNQPGCPEIGQFFWVERDEKPWPITGYELLNSNKTEKMYDPITGQFSSIYAITVITQPLAKIQTRFGARSICSWSHKLIKNTADKKGTYLKDYGIYSEVLSFLEPHSILMDSLDSVVDLKTEGQTLKISLEENHIYVSGDDQTRGIAAHNRKPEPVVV